jgi:hypothetical protein
MACATRLPSGRIALTLESPSMRSCTSAPVLVLFFNRSGSLARVLERVRAAGPDRVYLACDGPRGGVAGDRERVEEARRLALGMRWPMPPVTRFLPENAGCARAVSEAITWFFANEPEGIVLEDDCVPDPTFFPYASELLERYRDDERVMSIDGTSFDIRERAERHGKDWSYAFSRSPHVWGWASWARAWKHFKLHLNGEDVRSIPRENFPSARRATTRGWSRKFSRVIGKPPSTWDYQWTFAHFAHGGLVASPRVNLVTNLRLEDGTHLSGGGLWQDRPLEQMRFPLRHPPGIAADRELDAHLETVHCNHRPWIARRLVQFAAKHGLWRPTRSRRGSER